MEAKDTSITGGSGTVCARPVEGLVVRMPGTRLLTRKVSGEQTGGAYSLFEVEVGPGGGERPHVQHREDECFYVLDGSFGFVVEDEEIGAGPGSLVYVPKGNLHAFENTGETTGRMLVLQTPGGVYERFVEEVGEPANGESVPPATAETPVVDRLVAVGMEHGIEIVSPLV